MVGRISPVFFLGCIGKRPFCLALGAQNGEKGVRKQAQRDVADGVRRATLIFLSGIGGKLPGKADLYGF